MCSILEVVARLLWGDSGAARWYHSRNSTQNLATLADAKKFMLLLVNFCVDLNRTFPDNVMFRKTADPCLQKTLYNVLLAYGLHNQDVGYCQVSPQSLRTGMF